MSVRIYATRLDLIVSAFEACFDSTRRLYLGMRDRAYYSARAILQINTGARLRSREHASNYPILAVPSRLFRHADPDLYHILYTLEHNSSHERPTLEFPGVGTNSHIHSLWMSNLFVDLTRVGPNPILKSYQSYLSAALSDHQATIANILLVWYLLLGGQVEEETFWATDKSDALEGILSCLSTRVMDVLADGGCLRHLEHLLDFLAAWEKRPACLTPMAYQWCSAISEAAGTLGWRKTHTPPGSPHIPHPSQQRFYRRLQRQDRQRPQQGFIPPFFISLIDSGFSEVGPGCDPVRLGNTSDRTRRHPHHLRTVDYADLLPVTLEIGFRLVAPFSYPPIHFHLAHHHTWVFETALSSDDDEVVADAVSALIAGGGHLRPGSYVRYATKRIEKDTPFSSRLRRASMRVVARSWCRELRASPLETIQLLNHLNARVREMESRWEWGEALVGVMCSPTGLENLSSHYWRVLGEMGGRAVGLVLRGKDSESFDSTTRLLEEAEDWEKLEVWMSIKWVSLQSSESAEAAGRAVFKLLMQRPSALPRFTELVEISEPWVYHHTELRRICDQARTEQPLPEFPPRSTHAPPPVPLLFAGDDTF